MRHDDGRNMEVRGSGVLSRFTGGAASALRAAAGLPAGVARSRRGTFLVVVIGTLALLAVIAIAHFAIGQQDRRTAASVDRAAKIDDVPDQFARYVQSVIAKDLFVAVPEEINEVMGPGSVQYQRRFLAQREARDIPATDWRVLTTAPLDPNNALPQRVVFTPEGVGMDPWLASTYPVWLNWTGDTPQNNHPEFEYRRDWAHISNIAPDGRFINLANLRNNFTSESGYGIAGGNKPRTSQGLTLSAWDPAQPQNAAGTTNRTDFGLDTGSPVGGTPNLARRRAATWDSRQVGAARSINEWQSGRLPSNVDYLLNQWADTDGDGIADARWFELVDARDTESIKTLLHTEGRMRWVFATRIVDLCGLMNVNTATDLKYAPGMAHPIGMTPADVDLKRLLSMQDAYAEWGVAYDGILQPPGAPQVASPGNYTGMNQQTARRIGEGAYESLRWALATALPPDRFSAPNWDWTSGGLQAVDRGVLRHLSWRTIGGSPMGASFDTGANEYGLTSMLPPSDMGELLGRFGANDPLETSKTETATGARGGRYSGLAGVREAGLDPLRSNRDESLELNKTRVQQGAGYSDTGLLTPESMLGAAVDVRSQLTTVSWARSMANLYGNDKAIGGLPSVKEFQLANEARNPALGTTAAQEQRLDGDSLFRLYVRSLAPAIRLTGVWPEGGVLPSGGGAPFQKAKTLFYGHQGPELALVSASTMAANMEAMTSPDGRLANPRTLILSADLAERMYNDNQPRNAGTLPAAPWFRMGAFCLDSEAAFADAPADRTLLLASGGNAKLQTPMLNLYGFEPQAFITEVGCFTVWRDTPQANGGDRDWHPRPPNDPAAPPSGYITIKGDVEESNVDLLFRCIAIQLHNPYSEPVEMTQVIEGAPPRMDDWPMYHYVRFMSRDQGTQMGAAVLCDATIDPDESGVHATGLTLQPGETVTCCVFDRMPSSVARRLENVGFASPPQSGGSAFLRQWMDQQFKGAGVNRVLFALGTDDAVSNVRGGFHKYIDDPTGNLGMTVQLWKTRRADMSTIGGQNELIPGAANLTGNDQLVDRLRLDANKTLDARLKDDNNDVDGCWGWNENQPFNRQFNFNTGLTVMRWATVSRPGDPKDGPSGTVPRGAVPAYLVEPISPPVGWHTYKSDHSGVAPEARLELDLAAADRMNPSHEVEFIWQDWKTQSVATTFSDTISVAPDQKPVTQITDNRDGKAFAMVRDVMPRPSRSDKGFNSNADEGVFAAKLPGQTVKASTLRPADLLLPMAICPWESPLKPDASFSAQSNPDLRYLTAAEAFAIAYGYGAVPLHSQDPDLADPAAIYNPAPAAPNSSDGNFGDTADRPVLTGGRLVIDDFVPFYDGNTNGRFDRGSAFNGIDFAQIDTKDIRFGLSIPAALNVLDQVNAYEEQFASLRRATPGVVNINTASPSVLRALPLVTPADKTWGGSTDLIWDNGWTQTSTSVDLAASILGYRDKRPTFALRNRQAPADFSGDSTAGRMFTNQAGRTFTEVQAGRAMATQMDGIREEVGFASIGELGCVLQRDRDDHGGTGTQRNNSRSIDFLGFNNPSRDAAAGPDNDRKGINSLLYKPTGGGAPDVDQVKNDYAERLQVVNALANVTTVRSDVFACWFVIRGYTPEDCEDLGPDDPMTPSVERRFLMVIDRSNVTSLAKDPKPRVILFKELPK